MPKKTPLNAHDDIWASTRENLSSGFASNKGADQPAHPHRLIRAFVIGLFESIISNLAASEILIFLLVSVAEQAGLNLIFSELPKTDFLATRPISSKARSLKFDLSFYLLRHFGYGRSQVSGISVGLPRLV